MTERINTKKRRALDRLMIRGLVVDLVHSIPGRSEAYRIMENVLGMMETRIDMNLVWRIMENDRNIQEWVQWRIRVQRFEEIDRIKMKNERLAKVKRLKEVEARMDWMDDAMEDEEMDWEMLEEAEHKALECLMRELEIKFEYKDDQDCIMKDIDCPFEDDIEHEILDKILQECEEAEKEWSTDLELGDQVNPISECIKTFACAGNCESKCSSNILLDKTASVMGVGRGENGVDMKKLSQTCMASVYTDNVQCTVECTVDCTVVQQGSQLTVGGETGYIIHEEQNLDTLAEETSNKMQENSNIFPNFTDWLDELLRGDGLGQEHRVQDGHLEGEERAQGGEVMGGGGGGEGRVRKLISFHENSAVSTNNIPRMKRPRMQRGVRRDCLIQTSLSGFVSEGGRGARKLPGQISIGGGGKRKFTEQESESPGAKISKIMTS